GRRHAHPISLNPRPSQRPSAGRGRSHSLILAPRPVAGSFSPVVAARGVTLATVTGLWRWQYLTHISKRVRHAHPNTSDMARFHRRHGLPDAVAGGASCSG